MVELDFLNGRKKFPDTEVFSLLHYDKRAATTKNLTADERGSTTA